MAIQTVYYRQKIEGTGWRYRPLTVGRRPEVAKNGPTLSAFATALESISGLGTIRNQPRRRLQTPLRLLEKRKSWVTVDDLTNEANTNRISIKTAVESYLQDGRFGRPRSIAAYENAFDQLPANLPRGVRFIDQLATSRALNSYVDFLRGQSYSNKTITIRVGFVFSLLKANGVDKSSKLIKLPNVRRTRTKAYNPDELAKLFAAMSHEQYLR